MKVVRIHPKARARLFRASFTPRAPFVQEIEPEESDHDTECQETFAETIVETQEVGIVLDPVMEVSHGDAVEEDNAQINRKDPSEQEITQQEVAATVIEADRVLTPVDTLGSQEATVTDAALDPLPSPVDDDPMEIRYVDRVKHVFSHWHTTDEEVAYAETLQEIVDTIVIQTKEDKTCEVTVQTDQAVYHFYRFRTNYEGHSSRALLKVLDHFNIALSMDFLLDNPTMTIYVTGQKIAVSDMDYVLHYRLYKHRIVEPVQWFLSSDMLDRLDELAMAYDIDIELVVEQLLTMQMQENEQKESPADL